MRSQSRCELEAGDRHVGEIGRDVAAPAARHLDRHLPDQPQDDGDVVRGEAPERVLFGSDLSEVQPVRIDVVDAAERRPPPTSSRSAQDRRVVLQKVSDHQDPAAPVGLRAHLDALRVGQRQGLLDEDVLAGSERPAASGSDASPPASRGRRPRCRCARRPLRSHRMVSTPGAIAAARARPASAGSATSCEGAELMEVPNQVLAPVATAEDGDPRRRHRSSPSGSSSRTDIPSFATAERNDENRMTVRKTGEPNSESTRYR